MKITKMPLGSAVAMSFTLKTQELYRLKRRDASKFDGNWDACVLRNVALSATTLETDTQLLCRA